MTQQEQRPAVEVWRHANRASLTANNKQGGALAAATAIIEADRAATRAAVVAEICEWLREGRGDHASLCVEYQIAQRFGGRDD